MHLVAVQCTIDVAAEPVHCNEFAACAQSLTQRPRQLMKLRGCEKTADLAEYNQINVVIRYVGGHIRAGDMNILVAGATPLSNRHNGRRNILRDNHVAARREARGQRSCCASGLECDPVAVAQQGIDRDLKPILLMRGRCNAQRTGRIPKEILNVRSGEGLS